MGQHSRAIVRAMARSRRAMAALALTVLVGASLGVSALVVKRAHAASLSVCLTGSCTYHSLNDALAAASAGDTISVAAGTYTPAAETTAGASTTDATVTVSKAVTIQGAGAGATILNVASAYVNTSAGSGVVRILNPGGNVTLSGFTIEGSNVNDPNGDGIMVAINDTNAGDLITVRNNTFREDATLDPGLLADQVDAIYVYDGTATVDILSNRFEGIFRAALVEGNLGPLHFQHNLLDTLHGINDTPSASSPLDFGAEGVFFLVDNFANSTAIQDVSSNTFQNFPGMAVGAEAGYHNGNLVGAVNNLAITNNTFHVEGVNTVYQGETSVVYLRGIGSSGNGVTSLISGVSIDHNTFAMTSNGTAGHGHAIRFRGAIGTNNSVTHNSIVGGGSTVPLDGVEFDTNSSSDDVRIGNNIIRGFQNGIHADALPGGANVRAHQNCIAGNTVFGATNDPSGASINAQANWWGAATGPNTAGADNASANIDTSSFLTAPAGICQAPTSALVTVTGADVTPTGAWSYADTRNAATGTFVLGAATPPYGVGSFRMTTGASIDKAQLMTNLYTSTKLADVDGISYQTYRDPAATGFSAGVAGLNLRVFFDSTNLASYRYMVYEPYQDQGNSAVLTGAWQLWDAYRGGQARWWITGTFGTASGCGQATPCTWAHILALFPNAVILDDPVTGPGHFVGSFGVNQGSGNTGFITNVDGLSMSVSGHETTFNFEPPMPSASLGIGTPTYTAGGTTYVTSASVLTLTGAEPAGTISSVSYRICPTNCAAAPAYTTTAGTSATFSVTGADGVYEVDYYATDSLTQQSAPLSKLVTLDNTPPTATISIGQPRSTSGGITYVGISTPFTVSATDGGSGVATVSYRFFLKGGTAPAFTVASGASATFTLSGAFGEYEVDYKATDNLGNDPFQTIFVTLTSVVPGEDVAGNAPAGTQSGSTSSHVPVGVSQTSGNSRGQVNLPKPSRVRQAGQLTPTSPWLTALWGVLALLLVAGAGVGGWLAWNRRRAPQR